MKTDIRGCDSGKRTSRRYRPVPRQHLPNRTFASFTSMLPSPTSPPKGTDATTRSHGVGCDDHAKSDVVEKSPIGAIWPGENQIGRSSHSRRSRPNRLYSLGRTKTDNGYILESGSPLRASPPRTPLRGVRIDAPPHASMLAIRPAWRLPGAGPDGVHDTPTRGPRADKRGASNWHMPVCCRSCRRGSDHAPGECRGL